MINKYFFPLLSIWSIAAYLHLINVIHIYGYITSLFLAYMLFIPVVFAEIKFSSKFHSKKIKDLFKYRTKVFWLLIGRLVFWFLIYQEWCVHVPISALTDVKWLQWFAPKFYMSFLLVSFGEGWISIAAFLAWIAAYYVLTIKKRRLRLFTGGVLPLLLFAGLFSHLYYAGGRGGINLSSIENQTGVVVAFDIKKKLKGKIKSHPRYLYYSKKAETFLITYGCTYCNDKKHYPTILKVEMNKPGGNIFKSTNIRKIFVDEERNSVFVGPWYQNGFYEISLGNLALKAKYRNQIEGVIDYWEPMDMLKDDSVSRIYIANDVQQALISYSLQTGKMEKALLLNDYVEYGGPVWHLAQSKKTRKIYFLSGPGSNIFIVDPDELKVLKHKDLPDIIGTALVLDEENGSLYYQCGGFNALYELDMETLEIKRKLKGERHARCMALDKKRNRLYILGYFSGTVFPVDLKTGKKGRKVRVGGSPHGMVLLEDNLWINSMRGVVKVDLEKQWAD